MRRSSWLFDLHDRPRPPFAAFLHDVQVPGDDLASIDAALQARFFQKDPVTQQPRERWELKEVEVQCPPERIRGHLATCGFLKETKPNHTSYAYAAWPGGLVTRAVVRLTDLVRAYHNGAQWGHTLVFGGKRPLQLDKESYELCCKALGTPPEDETARSSWKTINPTTELEMMRFLWENIEVWHPECGSALKQVPITFVDAPMKPVFDKDGNPVLDPKTGKQREDRPNTEDTIHEWLKGVRIPGPVLLSSGAPYGMAQDEAFWTLLEPRGFTVETFGHEAPDLPIENFMREVAGCVNRIRKARLPS